VIVPFDSDAWDWADAGHGVSTFAGRPSVLAGGDAAVLLDRELEDGTIELELGVGRQRGFYGVVWRARDDQNFESFYVRPHQVGNPDAVQYTPVFNGIPCWQLYHHDGFWAPVSFPLDDWFCIRVVFAGGQAEIYVGDLEAPALVSRLKLPAGPGRVGLLVGGEGVHLSEFGLEEAASLRATLPPPAPPPDGVIRDWEVSDAFAADELERAVAGTRSWTAVESEPSGLVNLARVQGIRDGRNTALVRTRIDAGESETRLLALGFSDRAVVYLNGRPLYRGDDTYRSRDYRFLGSIGWYDALYLPLETGENELVVAVSEDLGGWGLQARLG
jgi:hypothetical protein